MVYKCLFRCRFNHDKYEITVASVRIFMWDMSINGTRGTWKQLKRYFFFFTMVLHQYYCKFCSKARVLFLSMILRILVMDNMASHL